MNVSDPIFPVLTSPELLPAGHAVQFYDTDAFLCEVIGRFAVEGLVLGESMVLIATPDHMRAISSHVAQAGLDVDAVVGDGRFVMLDAEEVLSRFMTGGMVDDQRCRETLTNVLRPALARGGGSVRAFGEMVNLLWRGGETGAALRLEEIWNEIIERYAVTLVCGYAMTNFARAEHEHGFLSVCDHHAHVLPAEGYVELGAVERDREFNRLRQRARALEEEIEHRNELEQALRDALAARRSSEEDLRAAKEAAERASSAKSEFLAVMSHELRTPLNAIFGYEDLLRNELGGPLTERQVEYLNRLRSSADQLLDLVNQVLQLSRMEAGQEQLELTSCSPVALIREAIQFVEPMAAARGIALSVSDRHGDLELRTDVGKLRQILLNLLSNAVKFTERGSVSAGVREEDGMLCIDVTDTGIGIESAQVARIFEPFIQGDSSMTRRYGGTGLGLSVSRNLAHLLGGDISVTSTPGEGSTFTVSLPRR